MFSDPWQWYWPFEKAFRSSAFVSVHGARLDTLRRNIIIRNRGVNEFGRYAAVRHQGDTLPLEGYYKERSILERVSYRCPNRETDLSQWWD